MIANYAFALAAAWKFFDYRPQRVTPRLALRWIEQFPKTHHPALRSLIQSVEFVNERSMVTTLAELNIQLLRKLKENGVKPSKVIYACIHDAGSSSSTVLGLLRDKCRLENLGCRFIEANNTLGFHKLTKELEAGAIVYVDDFAGTGDQFCQSREILSQTIVGNFSEFFLVHTICEEAVSKIQKTYVVEPIPVSVHERRVRPLHALGTTLSDVEKRLLHEACQSINARDALGYDELAANVVFYRNSPNGVPRVLRGEQGQRKYFGILPRVKDLSRPAL